ncbi:plasmid stabilization protein [Pseudomonas graminis]|uniref:Plasmid stabilization protein n=1 Tax=Pseudomonas graminis TaxID=158627 RepID=A0A1C2DRV9_9PSED|nr:plasmid stabilization protein [Pseudomonas graminis]OCX17492.1 plasmid stabilization protein [Pseudomonas graminis]
MTFRVLFVAVDPDIADTLPLQGASLGYVDELTAAPTTLLTNPRIGERLEEFEPRDVRRIQIGQYEMRYEIVDSTIYLLRLWHTREDR